MVESFLDRVFDPAGAPADQRAFYDEWATSYDRELRASGYETPHRLASALASVLEDPSAPVLDFGCGTGLSGEALRSTGLLTVDGCDLSAGMIEVARGKGVYRRTWQVEPGVLDYQPGIYRAVSACGVISVSAAPAETLDLLAGILAPRGLLAFSYNDHTLADDGYMARLEALLADGFEERVRQHGTHIRGRAMGATVFVLERRS